ncbi:hypothetical protein VaNZ11_010676 [Volvox africanus]|uniref:Uncharacterized protein n=1 Tax=Volvox africanus TaxID=51714 RepID=A0ABQ5S9W1_9CHLO|nr:hypothetical protein VaNZ11_010676 [Volvox africanus]
MASEDNEADAASCWDDYCLHPQFFHLIERCFGPHDVDLFVPQVNAHLPCVFSRHHCPGSSGVNVLLQPWAGQYASSCLPVDSDFLLAVVQKVRCYSGGPILDSSTVVAAAHGVSSGSCFPPVQHGAIRPRAEGLKRLPAPSELAGRSGPSSVVDWARSRGTRPDSVVFPRYGLNLGSVGAPPVVSDLLVAQLQSYAPRLDHSERLRQVVQVVMARISASTWWSYFAAVLLGGSYFAAFVHFCLDEGFGVPPSFAECWSVVGSVPNSKRQRSKPVQCSHTSAL